MRILGVNLDDNKRLGIALTKIYGIGRPLAKTILAATNVEDKKCRECNEEEYNRINSYIEKNIECEGALRAKVTLCIKTLSDIQCYRGIRHIKNLPVRGQNTRTNCRTRKGPRKVVANKKKAEK